MNEHHRTFESIRHIDGDAEFWLARELQPLLEYGSWDKFLRVIKKAMDACRLSGHATEDHFSQLGKMVEIGSNAERKIADFKLSRYACYLIVQNGDSSKSVIANGQTYFAIQARRQEIADSSSFSLLSEEEKRIALRNELKEHNKQLVEAAQQAGVQTTLDFAIFQDHGYQGLYGGLGAKQIHGRKGLKKSQKILDHMGSTELAANLFRATQAEEKIRRDMPTTKISANRIHFTVGATVREAIRNLGGVMPENLPTPAESIQTLERRRQKRAIESADDEPED